MPRFDPEDSVIFMRLANRTLLAAQLIGRRICASIVHALGRPRILAMAIRPGGLNMLARMATLLLLASPLLLRLHSRTSILDLFAALFLHLMCDKPDINRVEPNIMRGGSRCGTSVMTDMTTGSAARLRRRRKQDAHER